MTKYCTSARLTVCLLVCYLDSARDAGKRLYLWLRLLELHVIELSIMRGFESLRLYGQVNKRTWWMPWQPEAMKDAVGSEMPRGAVKQALIRGCPNGETHSIYRVSCIEYIDVRGKRRELKHLSTCRKRNQLRFPQ